jgi:hypothetical protein
MITMRTYYLFLDKDFCIQNVFENLRMAILEPGIIYKEIKQHSILSQYIVLESIYKDQYLLKTITEELKDMGYDKSIEILKPLLI